MSRISRHYNIDLLVNGCLYAQANGSYEKIFRQRHAYGDQFKEIFGNM
jgi:hypothetical protein